MLSSLSKVERGGLHGVGHVLVPGVDRSAQIHQVSQPRQRGRAAAVDLACVSVARYQLRFHVPPLTKCVSQGWVVVQAELSYEGSPGFQQGGQPEDRRCVSLGTVSSSMEILTRSLVCV